MNHHHDDLLEALKCLHCTLIEWAHPTATRKNMGLCEVIYRRMLGTNDKHERFSAASVSTIVQLTSEWMREWKHYSGNRQYPVPHPSTVNVPFSINKRARAAVVYNHSFDMCALYTGEYGQLRMKLLQFLIENLAKYIASFTVAPDKG